MSRLFDDAFNSFLAPLQDSESVSSRGWMPAVDIRETDEAVILYAELPGLTREEVEITLENNVLTLGGERKLQQGVNQNEFHRIERAYGTFSRSFSLPTNLDTDKVTASFENGVLAVTLPKAEESKPRTISIK